MRGAQVSVVSIPVADQERAKKFYVEVLGFDVVVDNPFGEGMRWVMLRPPGGGAAITLVTWFPEMRPGSTIRTTTDGLCRKAARLPRAPEIAAAFAGACDAAEQECPSRPKARANCLLCPSAESQRARAAYYSSSSR